MTGTIITPVLIGRRREMEILERALHAARNGAGGCVLLAGEAGIGKSRLATELCDRAVSARFWIWQGYCSELEDSFPYAPWIDALRAFLAPRTAAQAMQILGPLAPELVKLLPGLSLQLPAVQPAPPLDPAAEKHRLFETLTRLAVSLAATHPLLIVLEDLHLSDEQSLELLHFFARRIPAVPILILGTYRSEDSAPRLAYHLTELNRAHLMEEIPLAPLARSEVNRMVQAILKTESLISPDWLDLLMPLTEGNPFFVEEMTKSLLQTGAPAGQGDAFQIPRSIQQTIQRRVDEQPERARHMLSLASVIGERFDFALLQAVAAAEEQSLVRMLKELIAAQLIVEKTADQYAFRHALTREVIYTSLMLRERQAMHRVIGAALERTLGTQAEAPAASLAYHFYQAGELPKAMAYSQRAGERAQALYAPGDAVTHFTRAIEAARQSGIAPPRAYVRERAQAYEALGNFDHARSDYEIGLELARQSARGADEWQSLVDLGFLWQSREWVRAGQYFERAYGLARSLEETKLIAQSLNRIGHWHAHGGQFREALADHQQALELFKDLNDRRGVAQTLELLGFDSYAVGEVVQGAVYCEQAVPILRELDDRQGLVNTLTTISLRVRFDTEVIGETDLAQLAKLCETALEIARSCDYRAGEAAALHEGAVCLCRAGEYGQGWEKLRRALAMAEEIEHRELLTSVHDAWGSEFYLGLLALAEAREHLEAARAAAQERGSAALTAFVTARLVTVCILQNDWARAQALLDRGLPADLPDFRGMTAVLRSLWAARAELELALGHPARALEIIERLLAATANLAQYGRQSVPRLSQLCGQALVALGRIEEAVAEFRGAQIVVQKHGHRPMLWRLHTDLGQAYRRLRQRTDAEREFSLARTIVEDLATTLPPGGLHDHFVKQALATIPAALVLTPRQVARKEFGGLTQREREVAALIAQGKSNREIAEILVITVRTVEANMTRIRAKLGFTSRTEIATWAVTKGLAQMPDDSAG